MEYLHIIIERIRDGFYLFLRTIRPFFSMRSRSLYVPAVVLPSLSTIYLGRWGPSVRVSMMTKWGFGTRSHHLTISSLPPDEIGCMWVRNSISRGQHSSGPRILARRFFSLRGPSFSPGCFERSPQPLPSSFSATRLPDGLRGSPILGRSHRRGGPFRRRASGGRANPRSGLFSG